MERLRFSPYRKAPSSYMGLFFSLSFFFHLFIRGFCATDFSFGHRVQISVPSLYDPNFWVRESIMKTDDNVPNFQATLSIEAIEYGKYICSLDVFLGSFRVWNSGHFSQFSPRESCALELMEDGILRLRDSRGNIGWQTRTSGEGVKKLQLLHNGNLVLVDMNNNIKWQSFDLPADTILLHQRLYVPSYLTSATCSTTFNSFEIQNNKLAMYLHTGRLNYSYWEFRPNNSQDIAFVQMDTTGLNLFNSREEKIAQIKSKRKREIRFATLGKTGNLGFFYYSRFERAFEASFHVLRSKCDLPLSCGPYGMCSSSNTCECPQLSEQTEDIQSEKKVQIQQEMVKDIIESKCDEAFSNGFCGRNDKVKMIELKGVITVLRSTTKQINITKEECISLCVDDCSCTAVSFSINVNITRIQQECFHYEFVGGMKEDRRRSEVSFLVKVQEAAAESHESRPIIRKWILVLVSAIDGVSLLLIVGGVVYYFVIQRRMSEK